MIRYGRDGCYLLEQAPKRAGTPLVITTIVSSAQLKSIAATLGGSKGTLWSYFASKEILFAAVIDRVTDAFRAQLSLILNPRDGVESALRRFGIEFLRKVSTTD